jgi:fibronectin-binding autotransporter adhesin
MKLTCTIHDNNNFSKLLRLRFGVLVSLSAGLLLAFHGQAAVKTWDGSSNGNWGTAANWTGGVAPVDGDDLVFPSGAANLINTNNLSGLDLRTITFTGNGYTINGNAITITNGISGQQATGANTINPGITLGASQTFDCINAGASQQFNGTVALGLSFNLTISGAGNLGFAGVISGGGGSVSKSGAGTVTFSGASANTYTGITYVYGGVLQLSKAVPLTFPVVTRIAIPGDLVVGSGSIGPDIVRLFYNNQIANTSIVSVNGAGILDLNGNNDTIGISLIMNGNAEIWSGAGVLTLGSNCTVTGNPTGTSRIGGNLNIGASGTCTFDILDDWFYLDAVVSGGANIVKTGAGRLFFNAANTFTGSLTADDGTVGVTDNLALGANGSPTSGTVISNTATLQIWTAVNVGNEYLTLNTTAPTVALFNSSDTNSWAGPITLIGTQVIDVWPGTLELSGAISGSGGIIKIGSGTLQVSGNADNTYPGLTIVNEGELDLNKTPYVKAIAPYGQGIVVGDGTGTDRVRWLNGGQLWSVVTPVRINSSGVVDLNGYDDYTVPLTLAGGQILTGTGSVRLSGTVAVLPSPGSAVINGNVALAGSLVITNLAHQAEPDLSIYAAISGSPGITKDGAGNVLLGGGNTYSGLTVVRSGTLQIENDSALGATAAGTVVSNGAALFVGFGANNVGEPLSLVGVGPGDAGALQLQGDVSWNTNVVLTGDTLINCFPTNYYQAINGVISGVGDLTRIGPGTLTLGGSSGNTCNGDTYLREGVTLLNKSSGQPVQFPNLLVIGGTTVAAEARELANAQVDYVRVDRSGLLNLNGYNDALADLELLNGGDVQTGAGMLTQSGGYAVTVANPLSIGSSSISGNMALGSGERVFNVTNGGSLQMSAAVSGTGNLTKIGPGYLYLQATNSYSGLTIVQQGFLWTYNAWSLGTTIAGSVVSNGASLVMQGDFGITNESLILNGAGANSSWGALDAETSGTNFWTGPITLNTDSTIAPYGSGSHLHLLGALSGVGGLTKGPGSGTLYLDGSAANTYAGTTRVNSGTLVLNKTGFDMAVPGALTINGTVRLLNVNQIANTSDVTISGSGLLDIAADYEGIDTLSGNGNVNLTDGYLVLGYGNGSSTFTGVISGPNDLRKNGTGTITLTASNTYSGDTYITAGTLLVNGFQPQSPVSVSGGATLGGSGTVGNISCSANLAPGTSASCLSSSNLTFTATGDYYVELNGYLPCSGYDQMIVRGTNNLANATLHVSAALPGTPSVGTEFIIINNDGSDPVTGTFNGLADGATFDLGGIGFQIDYQGGDGNDVTLTVINAPGASVTLNATDRGWYDSTGQHNASNNNYVAGDGDGTTNTWRNWFVFDVPAFTGTIVQAELLINCYSNVSPYGQESFVLRHISTPIATLRAGGSGLTGIYDDLADGTVYAVRAVSVLESGERAIVPLNISFIQAATAATGSQIALGGAIATLDSTNNNNQRLFGYSVGPATAVQLRLTFGTSMLMDAATTGWYRQTGDHTATNANYFVGESSGIYRDFFVFNLPALPGQPMNAQLSVKPYTMASPTGFVSYHLREVATPISMLTNTATSALDVFADLGEGEVYGGREVFVSEAPAKLGIPLNGLFLAAALANSGGQIALGGALALEPTPNNERLFAGSPLTAVPGDVQLWLGFVPASGPGTYFAPGTPVPLGGDRLQFVLSGVAGTTNEIQASMDFVNWDAVRTLYMTNTTTTFYYTNTVFPGRYFRARLLQ